MILTIIKPQVFPKLIQRYKITNQWLRGTYKIIGIQSEQIKGNKHKTSFVFNGIGRKRNPTKHKHTGGWINSPSSLSSPAQTSARLQLRQSLWDPATDWNHGVLLHLIIVQCACAGVTDTPEWDKSNVTHPRNLQVFFFLSWLIE